MEGAATPVLILVAPVQCPSRGENARRTSLILHPNNSFQAHVTEDIFHS
jgi:hypothetical protein